MPALWQTITLSDLGVPIIPPAAFFHIPPTKRVTTWITHLKPNPKSDYFLILRSESALRNFIKLGGDPTKAIIHHLSYDTGVIDPLWGKGFMDEWCGLLKELGVKYIIPPDFSAWADMPFVLQLNNVYKSVVVARDFADRGFKLFPLMYWTVPVLYHLMMGMWPEDAASALVDGGHIYKSLIDTKLFFDGAAWMLENRPALKTIYVYSRSPVAVVDWNKKFPHRPAIWQPSVMYARNKLIEVVGKKASQINKKLV